MENAVPGQVGPGTQMDGFPTNRELTGEKHWPAVLLLSPRWPIAGQLLANGLQMKLFHCK